MGDSTPTIWVGDKQHESMCRCEICEQIRQSMREEQRMRDIKQRIIRKRIILESVDRSGGVTSCWEWQRSLRPDGYGQVGWRGTSQLAHRSAYELWFGPIPKDMQVDHKCRNRKCVNPLHLHCVTSKQNNENRGTRSASASGYRNVYWSARDGRWVVRATHNGRKYFAGRFENLQDAIAAARILRNSLFTNNQADKTTLDPVL